MSSPKHGSSFTATGALILLPMAAAIAQSSVTISPFVSYVPSAATNPLAGMALTFGGTTGLALRGSADLSVSNPGKTTTVDGETGGYRPWSADADAMLFLGGLRGGATMFSRSLAPYVFAGLGLSGGDSSGVNVVQNGWSYGVGTTIPLGFDAGLFGEARWRMPKYVLPTSNMAPDSKSELRFGLSFNVGGSRQEPDRGRRGGGRRMDDYDGRITEAQAEQTPIVVAAPAPVIIQQPAPVVVMQPEPEVVETWPVQSSEVIVDRPATVVYPERRRSRRYETATAVVTSGARVLSRSRGIVYRAREAASAKQKVATAAKQSGRTTTARTTTRTTSTRTTTAKPAQQTVCSIRGCRKVTTRER